jgi:hypothetical protein
MCLLQEGAEETEMITREEYIDSEIHFAGVDRDQEERTTKNIKLILGKNKDKIKFYLVHDNGYLSAETTDHRDADALVNIRQLMDMATLCLSYGAPLKAVCKLLNYHKDGRGEMRRTNTKYVPHASSVSDLIGRYLENRYIKCPIIKRILTNGIDPARALDSKGRRYIDWSVEDLKAEANGNYR